MDRAIINGKIVSAYEISQNYDEEKLETKVVLEDKIKAPISKGKILGSVTVLYDGEEYISAALTSPNEIKADNLKGFFKKIISILTYPPLLVGLGILLIIVVWSTLIFNRKKTYKIDKK